MKTNLTENRPLFTGYSKRKLYCLAQTYEELAKLYRDSQSVDKMLMEIGSLDRRDMLYRRELNETKQMFANHLEEISEAFLEVADTLVQVSMPLEHRKKAIIQYLKKHGIQVREVVFIEGKQTRRISMEARFGGRAEIPAEELADILSKYFKKRLMISFDSAKTLDRNYDFFIFEEQPGYTVISGMARAIKENEKISGDNFSIEEYNQNQMIAMISDGMGSGEKACRDSRVVIEFMEKFMDAGFSKEKALMLVNGAFFSKNPCADITTLDICGINLLNGEAEFIKAGAASSFVKRGTRVEEIFSETLPLGAADCADTMQFSIQLLDADMLIMVSDGVADAFATGGASRIRDAIAKINYVNPKEFARHLIKYAISCQGGRVRDDMTALVMYIRKE